MLTQTLQLEIKSQGENRQKKKSEESDARCRKSCKDKLHWWNTYTERAVKQTANQKFIINHVHIFKSYINLQNFKKDIVKDGGGVAEAVWAYGNP